MNNILNNLMTQSLNILVIGDIMLDRFVYGTVSRLSPEAPIPVLSDPFTEMRLGGAANVCKNIASLGINVGIMGVIGTDLEGDCLFELLNKSNISTSLVFRCPEQMTIVKTRYLSKDEHQFLRLDKECVFKPLDGFEIMAIEQLKCILNQYDIIILSDYAKGFLTKSLINSILSLTQRFGKKVIVDPKGDIISKYQGAYLIKPNLGEFRQFIGDSTITIPEILNNSETILHQLDLTRLLITCGSQGIILLRKGKEAFYQAATLRYARDVTGAGDTVTAMIAIGLLLNLPEETCVQIANYCAGIAVEKKGTSIISLDDVKSAMGPTAKILHSFNLLRNLRDSYQNEKLVFTNGCFDIMHAGHISLLKQAKQLGNILIVGINSDCSVQKLKGPGRPINDLSERVAFLAALPFVDWIIPYDSMDPLQLIQALRPDVLVKGADYKKQEIIGAGFVESYGGKVMIIPHSYHCSTTNIIDRIISKEGIKI